MTNYLLSRMDGQFLTEDFFDLHVEQYGDLLIFAVSSTGMYDQPCDQIVAGLIVESIGDGPDEFGVESWWVEEISRFSPQPDTRFFDLCQRQTATHYAQCGETAMPTEDHPSQKVDWIVEGF